MSAIITNRLIVPKPILTKHFDVIGSKLVLTNFLLFQLKSTMSIRNGPFKFITANFVANLNKSPMSKCGLNSHPFDKGSNPTGPKPLQPQGMTKQSDAYCPLILTCKKFWSLRL